MTSKLFALACLLALSQARVKVLDDIRVKVLDHNRVKFEGLSPRLVGGHDAEPGQFPHQVSMQAGMPPLIPYRHFCGGSLINESWVLTAAHCAEVRDELPSFIRIQVKAGKHNIRKLEETEQSSQVEKYYVHEKYAGGQSVGPYDIALLKLKSPFKLNDRVYPAALPEQGDEPTGTVKVSGWGDTSGERDRPKMPAILQTEDVPVIPRDQCNKAVEDVAAEEKEEAKDMVHESNVCTGPLTGGVSACSGDSGGPLTVRNKDDKAEVVGVASWAMFPCGRPGAPAVFTKVSYYTDWINNIMTENTTSTY